MTDNEQRTLARPSTHVLAIVSLVLSILGMLPILPLVGSIGGIITGYIARKEIKARSDLHTGDGTAQAGIILGWVGFGMIAVACLVAIISIALFRISSGPTILSTQPVGVPIQP